MRNGGCPVWLIAWTVVAALPSAYRPLAAQRSVGIMRVKQLDTSMQVCGDEPAYEVSLRDGIIPVLEFKVWLKSSDTTGEEEVNIRIDLVDANGKPVEMADSALGVVDVDPPWNEAQGQQIRQYLLPLQNRRPTRLIGSRFKIRVSIDSAKATAKESRVFRLYWTQDLKQQLCKPLTDSTEAPDAL